jgi:hypothetical protein
MSLKHTPAGTFLLIPVLSGDFSPVKTKPRHQRRQQNMGNGFFKPKALQKAKVEMNQLR